MYYQYELTHFEGDMGHGVASDDYRRRLRLRRCAAASNLIGHNQPPS
jgi:hypothetical protein